MKNDKKGYSQFAYQLGIAYFYCYEDTGNRILAIKWFEAALNTGMLTDQQETRASKLIKIAEYYSAIGKTSKSGDLSVSYADYWNDLVEVTTGDIVESDNVTTAMIVYCEACTQIYNHAKQFKDANISKADIENLLNGINQTLVTKIEVEIDAGDERNDNLLVQTKNALDMAYQAIETAYITGE